METTIMGYIRGGTAIRILFLQRREGNCCFRLTFDGWDSFNSEQ